MAQESFDQLHAAVKQAESRGQRYDKSGELLTSPKGAQGEMQVMPATQLDPGYGVAPAKDKSAAEIARVGKDYLSAMLGKYGNEQHALVAYNWGPKNADTWLASGANPAKLPAETQNYLQKVQEYKGKPLSTGTSAKKVTQIDLKDAGESYKTALAMSYMIDSQGEKGKKDEEDMFKEDTTPEAPEVAAPSPLANLDLSFKSPFPEVKPPVHLASGGEASLPELTLQEKADLLQKFADANTNFTAFRSDTPSREQMYGDVRRELTPEEIQQVQGYEQYQAAQKNPSLGVYAQVDAPTFTYHKEQVTVPAPMGGGATTVDKYYFDPTLTTAQKQLQSFVKGTSDDQIMDAANTLQSQAQTQANNRVQNARMKLARSVGSSNLAGLAGFHAGLATGGMVHRADGSPETGELTPEEIAAASQPAFLTPKSGIGRKEGPISKALNSGEAYPAIARGVSELPYDVVGGPVDIMNMVVKASPLISRYAPEKPVMGSDWIKEKMTKLGIRPGEEASPTLQGFRTMGELGASATNPVALVQGASESKAADMLRRAFASNTEARAAAAKQAAHAERLAQAEETLRQAMPVQIDLPFPSATAERAQVTAPSVMDQTISPVAPPVSQQAAAPAIGETVQPFVGRLDNFVSSLKGPVTKEQFMNQLKGKFRDYDLQRAETVLADLGASDKITPAQLTERLNANFSPRDFRIAVHSPEENKYGMFFSGMDNPFQRDTSKKMGVISLLQNRTPEQVAAHKGTLDVESAIDKLTDNSTLGSFLYTDKDVPTLIKYVEQNPGAVADAKEAKAALEKSQRYFQIALDRQNEIKSIAAAYSYPATTPNWSRYFDEAREASNARGEYRYAHQLTEAADQRVRDDAAEWLKKNNITPPSEDLFSASGYSDLRKYLTEKLDPLMTEAQVARNKVVNYVRPYLDEINTFQKGQQLYGGDPMHSPLTKQIGHYDPISFSRFTEHTLPLDNGQEVKGIFLHELQSDRLDDLVKKGPKGGSGAKDAAEMQKIQEGMQKIRAASEGLEPNLAVDAHIMDSAINISKLDKDSKTEAARGLYNRFPDKRETITEAFKLANRQNELNTRKYYAKYDLPESFAGMETNKAATQQLMLKTAIAAAMQRGDNFVAFPVTYGPGKSAQAQLYERLPYNLKQVIKDMGGEKVGFYTKQVALPMDDATDATTTAVFWGPETRNHVMKTGVPFAKGGSVERVSDDNRRYL